MKTGTQHIFAGWLVAALMFSPAWSTAFAGEIVARGSDSTIKAVKALAKAFEAKASVKIKVEGGGSSKGAKSCLAGDVDLAFMSRAPKGKEKAAGLVGMPYAIDGVAVIVHKNNPVDDLSMDQLKAIYTRQKKKWDNGKPILPINRPATSGTREVFHNKVLGKKGVFGKGIRIKHHKSALATVSKAVTAIAYTSAGALTGKEAVTVLKINGVTPTPETLRGGAYPISRTPHFATKGEAKGDVKAFLDFVMSDEGQQIVQGVGFVPLNDVQSVASSNLH